MDWLLTHIGTVSTVVSICTLFVWIFYAHVLWRSFCRSERPLILIHQAGGIGPGSSCLVVNLSRQPLHVLTVYFVLRTDSHAFGLRLNEYKRITNSEERDWALENVMKEGPLRSGEFLSLGDFYSMLEGARSDYDGDQQAHSERDQELAERTREFESRVTAMFSAFDRQFDAIRHCSLNMDGDQAAMIPTTPLTQHLTSYRQQRCVYLWLQMSRNRQDGLQQPVE